MKSYNRGNLREIGLKDNHQFWIRIPENLNKIIKKNEKYLLHQLIRLSQQNLQISLQLLEKKLNMKGFINGKIIIVINEKQLTSINERSIYINFYYMEKEIKIKILLLGESGVGKSSIL